MSYLAPFLIYSVILIEYRRFQPVPPWTWHPAPAL